MHVTTSGRAAGLSLIELLVVIAILAATAGMVISMTSKFDERARFDETARRLSEIRSAVLGPEAVSTTGDLLSGGYLQDMGWLPDSSTDLLRAPEASPGTPVPALTYDPTWRTWAGWRGPYLAAPPARKTGDVAVYDDYGNDFYGWLAESSSQSSWEIPRLSGDLAIRSMGSDGLKDAEGGKTGVFQGDYPATQQPLIAEAEWVTDLRGLQVEVTNLTAVDFSVSPVQARCRIIVPRWDHPSDPLGYWDSPDGDEFIGRSFSLDVAANDSETGLNQKVYDFATIGRSIRIPHGRRMLFLVRDSDGQPLPGVRAYAEFLVSRRLSPPSYVKLTIRY